MKTKGLLAFVAATAALSGGALAADISPIVVTPPVVVVPAPPTVAGYIDLHFGGLLAWEDFYIDDSFETRDDWRNLILGGGGRGAAPVGSMLNIQLDAWFNFVMGNRQITRMISAGGGDVGRGGIGMHLFADTAGGLNAGVLATAGAVTDFGMFTNVGVEASKAFGNFTVAAQGGFTFGLTGDAAASGYRNMYVRAGATAYLGPNTSIAANVGYNRTAMPGFDTAGMEINWGARAEHKLGTSPFTIFAAYHGSHWTQVNTNSPGAWIGTEHAVVVGVRMLFGRDTLQALDAAVPFADYNPTYGDPFIR
ncbi:MAG: hypothetical protein IT534_10065 [Bauldia sp.]|nr:hypothetical protein [Bauldia sp.]